MAVKTRSRTQKRAKAQGRKAPSAAPKGNGKKGAKASGKAAAPKKAAGPKRSERPEFQIAQTATAMLTADGKINLGSRVSSSQAQKVIDGLKTVKLDPKAASTKALKEYAQPASERSQEPKRKLSEQENTALVKLVDKIDDRYVWKRKTAAVVVAVREHRSR